MHKPDQPTRPLVRGARMLERGDEPALFTLLRRELERLGRPGHARCPFVLVEVDHGPVERCLVVDADWLQFAKETATGCPSATADLDLPTSALVAVLPGGEVDDMSAPVEWSLRPDGVLLVE